MSKPQKQSYTKIVMLSLSCSATCYKTGSASRFLYSLRQRVVSYFCKLDDLLFPHPPFVIDQNWVYLNLLGEAQRLQITGPEQLLHHFGNRIKHMLQCRLASLLIGGTT